MLMYLSLAQCIGVWYSWDLDSNQKYMLGDMLELTNVKRIQPMQK